MLIGADRDWLAATYPGLTLTATGGVSGLVHFSATYHRELNEFQILYPGSDDDVRGIRMDGTFCITIEERVTESASRLPALQIKGIATNASRHISPDGTACLCSPFVEKEFLEPNFSFRTYFEELVVPFLYGQLYYDKERDWPWDQYSHAGLGVLEAYQPAKSRLDVEECLSQLHRDSATWLRVRAILQQHNAVSHSVPCVCKRRYRMGRCHRRALLGLQQLRRDIRAMKISNLSN